MSTVRKRARSLVVDSNSNLDKIIIPYDFMNKKYTILPGNLEFYKQGQNYILSKVRDFGGNPLFSMDCKYELSKLEFVTLNLSTVIFKAFYLYLILFILLSSIFNIGIIIILGFVCFSINYILGNQKFLKVEKLKLEKIKSFLEEENKSFECSNLRIKWEVGLNGYWLEVVKLPY